MGKTKPILFNTEMVRVILAGRKTVTRRVIKGLPDCELFDLGENLDVCLGDDLESAKTCEGLWATFEPNGDYAFEFITVKAPYQPGDILWVRETFAMVDGEYVYRADDETPEGWHQTAWRPSIHMPREAARLFLQVKDVWVNRLRSITDEQAIAEGIPGGKNARARFGEIWDSTIKRADLPKYGWDANPWVWVIEFERVSKGEQDYEK